MKRAETIDEAGPIYVGPGGRIAEVVGPCEFVLSDGSHWRGSKRPLPWTRKGLWRRGDLVRVLRIRGVREGEDFLLMNAARRCRYEDFSGPTESRMPAAWLGMVDALPRSGWRRWLGVGRPRATQGDRAEG